MTSSSSTVSGPSGSAPVPGTSSGRVSMTSSTRSTPARACWPMVSTAASWRTGDTSTAREVGKAREGAGGGGAPRRQPAAEREPPHLTERRDRLEQRVVAGGEPDHPHPGAEQPPGALVDAVELAVLLAEALDHADAGDGRLDVPGDRTGLLLRGPVGREQVAPGP